MGFVELRTLVTQAHRRALLRARREMLGSVGGVSGRRVDERDLCVAGVCVQASDFDAALKGLQAGQAALFGTPHIPNVAWEDIGGLAEAKADILDTIQVRERDL